MAKFYTDRYYFKNGNEDDEVMCTSKEWDSFEKAEAYARRYASGIRFCYVEILDEDCNLLWKLDYESQEEDFRESIVSGEKCLETVELNIHEAKEINDDLRVIESDKYININFVKEKPLKRFLQGEFIRGSPE